MTSRPALRLKRQSGETLTGPGLTESLMWVGGYHLAQTFAGILLLVLLILVACNGLPDQWSDIGVLAAQLGQSELDWLLTALIGCATLGSLFFVLPMAFWRMQPHPRDRLGLQLPTIRQIVLLAGAVVPLGILSDELYRASSSLMDELLHIAVSQWPALAAFEFSDDAISLIQGQTSMTAYPQLLVIVGVGPAIGEEVIFRGLIGHGLTARWGVVRGVLMTSLLFAIAHISPSHALATIPIGIFLHVTYIATGSLWAPIIVHFLNNALSVTLMKYDLGQNVEVSTLLLVSSAVYVTVIAILLARDDGLLEGAFRLRLASRRLRSPLPVSSNIARRFPMTPNWLLLVACTGVICFTLSFVAAAMAEPPL